MNFGVNLYNWFLTNAQSLVLMAIVVIGIYLGFKREFSKLIGFLVVSLIAVGLVFNAAGVKDVLAHSCSIRSSAHKEWGVDVRYRQNRIKMLRRARGITVKRLAVLVGVSQSMLTNYENGSSIPRDQEVWDRLAVYFGVSVPYLMGF